MTFDEYKKLLGSMTAENFQTVGAGLLDELKKDTDATEAYQKQIAEMEKKNRELQDTNQSLFLRVTGTAPEEPKEKTKEELTKELLESI